MIPSVKIPFEDTLTQWSLTGRLTTRQAEAYLGPYQKYIVVLFAKIAQSRKAVNYFHKKFHYRCLKVSLTRLWARVNL